MPFQLKNEYLCLEMQKPGNYYKGARFDWSGQITQITFLNKHTFCTQETFNEFDLNKHGQGLNNEFGIDQPVGYNECPEGGQFPKIGVGLLKKKSLQQYNFFEEYTIDPYSFSFNFDENKASFRCKTNRSSKYSFELNKQILLDKNKFTISYTFFNRGENTIKTNEYVHNFLSINGKKIDQNYILFFSFPLEKGNFTEFVNPENAVYFKKNFCTWRTFIEKQFFFSNISTMYKGKENWTLIHLKDEVGIRESGDFIIQKVNLWGASHVISPEIFFQIEVLPGERISWSRLYEIFDFNNIPSDINNFHSIKQGNLTDQS